jgi:hypothetical protein
LRFDEVIFAIGVPLRVFLVDGDDLLPFREEVGAVVAEAMDHVRQAEAAVFDEGAALADVAPLLEVFGNRLHAGALPGEHWHVLVLLN